MPTWRKKLRRGGIFIFSGAFIGMLPLLVAIITGVITGYSPFSEGGGNGSGAVLWLLFITVPIGFVVGAVGIFYIITGVVKFRTQLFVDKKIQEQAE